MRILLLLVVTATPLLPVLAPRARAGELDKTYAAVKLYKKAAPEDKRGVFLIEQAFFCMVLSKENVR